MEAMRLRRQWAIFPAGEPFPRDWAAIGLGAGFQLYAHPDLHILTRTHDGRTVCVLGLAVRSSDPAASDEAILRDLSEVDGAGFAERVVPLAGTYAIVRAEPDGVRVYTDPAGMMNVYYRPGFAASSPSLLPELVRDERVDRAFPLSGSDNWYSGSLCPFVGVKALLANHVLDVGTGEVRRFWPTADFEKRSYEAGLAKAVELLRNTAAAYVDRRPVLCSITGGRDSRVSLAALRELRDRVRFFTIRGPGIKAQDLDNAAALVRLGGLRHEFVDLEPAPDGLFALYDEMTAGMSIGTRREIIGACVKLQAAPLLHLNGNLGALTKAYYWNAPRPHRVTDRALAKEFIRRPPCIMDGLREWRATLPDLEAATVYNLMYLEQRGGRWMGVGETASSLFYESASLFCGRQFFETVCGMPYESQRSGKLLRAFVEAMWPELDEVPYSSGTSTWKRIFPKAFKHRVGQILGRFRPTEAAGVPVRDAAGVEQGLPRNGRP